ncbi:peptidyl-prolyl cis-trans isomerase A (cyclophilin A) [Sphingomonas yantingensis]|uniref:peptidylprolyl isomerase n=2 Tax=Sphingomonas TaxID=13687 RepID=A0A7W9ANH8_9SPHN|nr:peptidyl-prolyl cis-trans isomerase A (cyclophilin A) [Sphingomonas yantingensis]
MSLMPIICLFAAALQTAPAPAPAPQPKTERVAIDTDKGRFVVAVETDRAPVTAANFLKYVDQKRLDGITFYRTVKAGEKFGFVQFGVQNDPKRALPPIRHEPTTQTGVKHLDGAISVARFEPGSARGDFTISVGDQPSLDADPTKPGDNLGYAAFGRVVEGMDVIYNILNAPTQPGGHFPGQMIAQPIKVLHAARLK